MVRTTKATRISTGSMPKARPRPPATPAIFRSPVERRGRRSQRSRGELLPDDLSSSAFVRRRRVLYPGAVVPLIGHSDNSARLGRREPSGMTLVLPAQGHPRCRSRSNSCDPGGVSSHSSARRPAGSGVSAPPNAPDRVEPPSPAGASDGPAAQRRWRSIRRTTAPPEAAAVGDSAVDETELTGIDLTPDGIPRLTRRRDGSIVGGVAAGIADHLRVQVLWVRVAFALMAVVAGAGVLAYALLWIFVPPGPDGAEARSHGPHRARAASGRRYRRPWHRADDRGHRARHQQGAGLGARAARAGSARRRVHLARGRRRPPRALAQDRSRDRRAQPGYGLAGRRRCRAGDRRAVGVRAGPTRLHRRPVRHDRGAADPGGRRHHHGAVVDPADARSR